MQQPTEKPLKVHLQDAIAITGRTSILTLTKVNVLSEFCTIFIAILAHSMGILCSMQQIQRCKRLPIACQCNFIVCTVGNVSTPKIKKLVYGHVHVEQLAECLTSKQKLAVEVKIQQHATPVQRYVSLYILISYVNIVVVSIHSCSRYCTLEALLKTMNSLIQHLVSEVDVFLNPKEAQTQQQLCDSNPEQCQCFCHTAHITDNKFSCFYMVIKINTVRCQLQTCA